MEAIQAVSLILPASYAAGTGTLTSTETVADTLTHVSAEFNAETLTEKLAQIVAIEVNAGAGAPASLQVWVELSPYPSANSDFWPFPYPTSSSTWGAIGGGGGVLPPSSPNIITPTGTVGTTPHNLPIPWSTHTPWCRIVVQQSASSLGYWVVQAYFSGRGS